MIIKEKGPQVRKDYHISGKHRMGDHVEYYLALENNRMLIGLTYLKDDEDEDDAFPRFLSEAINPFHNLKATFKEYYTSASKDNRELISIADDPVSHKDVVMADITVYKVLLDELVEDGFDLIAINKRSGDIKYLLHSDPHDRQRYYGYESTITFIDGEFTPIN